MMLSDLLSFEYNVLLHLVPILENYKSTRTTKNYVSSYFFVLNIICLLLFSSSCVVDVFLSLVEQKMLSVKIF